MKDTNNTDQNSTPKNGQIKLFTPAEMEALKKPTSKTPSTPTPPPNSSGTYQALRFPK